MAQSRIFRLLDANFNRTREALRVIEDGLRFCGDTQRIAPEMRALRHMFTQSMLTQFGDTLVRWRDVERDEGKDFAPASPATIGTIVRRNFSRAEESLRTIEEYCKTASPETVPVWAKIRFRVYQLEKKAAAVITPPLPPAPFFCLALPATAVFHLSGKKHPHAILVVRDSASDKELVCAARAAVRCGKSMVIVEDRADIAMLAEAKGVLLGENAVSPAEAKRIYPAATVGVRCGSWRQFRARAKNPEEVDFLVIEGNFSDPDASGVRFLTKARKNSTLPLIAGMDVTPAQRVTALNAGAVGVIAILSPRISGTPANTTKTRSTGTRCHGQKA